MTQRKLSDLLDMRAVQKMAEANYQAVGMPIGMIDAHDGSVLVGTGWQDICSRFHRANPQSLKRCEDSDRLITDKLAMGEARQYKCLNGLWDIGIPIVVAGQHLATLFLGQFFYEGEVPDREFFIRQAGEFGYDLDKYLIALDRVRVFSREKVNDIVAYNTALAGFIADLAEQALHKQKTDEDLRFANMLLRTQQEASLDGILIVNEAGQIMSYNQRFIEMWRIPPEIVASKSDELALQVVVERVVEPDAFLERIKYLYQQRTEHSHDEIRLKDGSTFERYSAPICGPDNQYYGRVWYMRDVTERKRAEEALRASEAKLQLTFEAARLGDWSWDIVTGEVIWSTQCKALYGLPPDTEITYARFLECVHPDDRTGVDAALRRAVETKGNYDVEKRVIWPDGSLHWTTSRGRVICNTEGQPVRLIGVTLDVTEHKQSYEALQQAALIVKNSPVILFRWRATEGWPVVLVSQNVTQLGYTSQELLSGLVKFSSIVHPDDLDRVRQEVQAYTANRVDRFQQEYRILTKDGQVRWVDDRTAIERDNTGQVTHYQGTVVDITDRKQVDEALRESQQMLRYVIDQFPGVVFWKDRQSVYLGCNRAFSTGAGLAAPEDIVGKTDFDLPWADTEAAKYRDDDQAVMSSGQPRSGIVEPQHQSDGRLAWFDTGKVPLFDEQGHVLGVLGASHDITGQVNALQSLQESEEKYRRLIEVSPVAMWINQDGIITYMNPAALRILGATDLKQVAGRPALDFVHPDYHTVVKDRIAQMLDLEQIVPLMEEKYLRLDGSAVDVEVTATPFTTAGGQAMQVLFQDITERKRIAAQTERALRETRMRFEVSRGLAGNETEEEVLDALIQLAGFYPKVFVVISTFNLQAGELIAVVRRQSPFESGLTAALSVGETLSASRYPLVNRFFAERTFVSNDIWNDERFEPTGREILRQTGAASFAAVTFAAGKEWLGYMTVMAKSPDYFDEEKQHLYETLAEQGAVALRAARLRKTIRESQQRLSLLIQQSPLAIIEWDLAMNVVSWNPAAERILGYTAEETIGQPIDLIVPKDIRSQIDSVWQTILTRKDAVYNTNDNVTKDGRLITCEWFNAPLISADGQVMGVVSFAQDITERKQMDAKLRTSEARYRALVESQVDLISRYRFDTTLTFVNDAYCQFYGKTREELLGQSWVLMVAPEYHAQTLKETEQFRQDPRPISGEYVNFRHDGTPRWIQWVIQGIVDDNGQVVELQATGRDITRLKQAEETVRELSRRNEAALRVAHMGHWEYDVPTGVFTFNDQYYSLHGITAAEAGGYQMTAERFTQQYVHPDDAHIVGENIRQAIDSNDPNYQTFLDARILRGDGELRYVIVWFRLESDPQGRPLKLLGVNQDVTERKLVELERERLITELERKNAELERFTYTVSHDLKSPLITIKGFLGFLEEAAVSGNIEQLRSDITRIGEAAKKMERLLSELLELSRIGRIINPPEVVPFGFIAREAVDLVRGQLTARQATVTIADDLPVVTGDRARLVEVIQNLVDNAVKFMGEQPHPHVDIGVRVSDVAALPVFFVRDNGVGIEPQYHQRVFGLFDKLDPRSEGTGVGLALVKRIIEVHGGRIWVESDGLGHGATFCFTLPGVQRSALAER